ncbi:uncharacterized protein J3D65DRAFT_386473 [Phyllosticta citribraziliensis]|uniref:Uncharacterized protein n=1 Tax=Phyllosticta citribraziliensis TaxID=989973 RepID=A0ABR1LQS8_9PEZI
MCRYRYMYYSGCCHAKLTLYDYCDDAYDAASLPTAPQGDCGEADDVLNHDSEHEESYPSPHLTDFPPLQNPSQHRHDADEDLIDSADRAHLTQRRQTYASIARASKQYGIREQPQRQKSATLASEFPNTSPAQKLASRFEQASKTTGNPLTLGRKTGPPSSLSTNPRCEHTIAPAVKAGREQADRGARSARGKRIAENTNVWGGSIVPRSHERPKSNLPEQAAETCAFDLNLDSSNDFPNLYSQTQAGPSPSSFISEPRSRSNSTASWAQVARLTSAVRPTYGSTSGNTVADSDTGTASATSFSSFQAEDFDGSFTATNMAPTGRETVPVLRGKMLPPLTTTGLNSIPQINRKTLPSEWLATSPNTSSPDVSRRKSVPSLRSAANSSKTASSPTKSTSSHSPGKSPTKSSTKSPTKVVPFKLETARRAAEREVKEKSSVELLKGKSKKAAKEAIDDPFFPSLPSSSAVAAKHHPQSTHTTHGQNAFTAEEHPWMPASPSHSRIPRLCNKFRNQEGLLSTHSELNAAIEHRGWDTQAQPSRLENFVSPGRQTLVQHHTNIERHPSPTVQHIEDISLPRGGPKSNGSSNFSIAPTETGRSDEGIGNTEAAIRDIKRRMVSDSSLAESSEDSTVILIDADAESDKLRSSAFRTRQGTYPGATQPLKKTQQEASARETPINHEGDFRRTSLQSQDSYLASHLRVTSNAGTDTVVTPNDPYDVVSPSQGVHWSTHYDQDLGRTAPPPPTAKRPLHRRIMSAPRVMHPNPDVLNVGPDVAKMSTPAVELLRMLHSSSGNKERPESRRPEPKPQAKTVTATALNAQAKEFVPQTLAQTHHTSGPFVITPNPGTGFPRPQIPSEWANASWVNAIPAHQANDSGTVETKSASTEDAQQPQESSSAAADTAVSRAEPAVPNGKKGKIKNRAGKAKQKGATRAVSAATSGSVANTNTNDSEQATGAASPQRQPSGTGSTRASTPHPALSSGYTTPSGSGISNVATAGGSEEKTATTVAAGPYAFQWDSTMRPSVLNLTTYHTGDQNHDFYPSNASNGAPSSSPGIRSLVSHRSNMTEPASSGFQFQFRGSPHSPASPLPFYNCTGGWRSDGGGPLRFESFPDMRASMLGTTGSQRWRPTYTHNTISNRGTGSSGKGGYLGYGINVPSNNKNAYSNGNKTWAGRGGGAMDGLAAKKASMAALKRTAAAASMAALDYAALAPCANAQVSEAYEVLPHCPVPLCPECLPDQAS